MGMALAASICRHPSRDPHRPRNESRMQSHSSLPPATLIVADSRSKHVRSMCMQQRNTMVKQANNPARNGNRRVPLIFAQAVIVALALCLGEILCAPLYTGMSYHSLALVPWSAIAGLLSVVFAYTVGFAALWAAGKVSKKAPQAWRPVIAALFGLVLFGVWGYFVFAAVLNSIIVPLGHAALAGAQLGSIAFNCAAVGLASFFCASAFGERLATLRTWVWGLFACTILFAAFGVFFVVHMAALLY